jgi:hypothetical protein
MAYQMNETTFLKGRLMPPITTQLERPISEHDVYQIWWRAGGIQRCPRKPWRLEESIVGLLAMGFAFGWCCHYFMVFHP